MSTDREKIILVSNDDGIDAPGIRALAEAMTGLGRVYVVAPVSEQSAVRASIGLNSDGNVAIRTIVVCVTLVTGSMYASTPTLVRANSVRCSTVRWSSRRIGSPAMARWRAKPKDVTIVVQTSSCLAPRRRHRTIVSVSEPGRLDEAVEDSLQDFVARRERELPSQVS